MSPYFLFDSLCVAVGRLRSAALLKRWSWLIWLWAHTASVLGQRRQRKQKRRFVFHRISVVRAKQCLSIDSLCACGHRFLPIYIFFCPHFFFFLLLMGCSLKRQCTLRSHFQYSPPLEFVPQVFSGWSVCTLNDSFQ